MSDEAGAQRPPAGGARPLDEVLVVGRRVVVRYAIDRATSPHGEGMTDALGTVLAVDAEHVEVMTRRGPVQVPRALILAAKQVPPPPQRRRPRPPAGWTADD